MDMVAVVMDVGMKCLLWPTTKDMGGLIWDLLTSGWLDKEVDSGWVCLDGWGLDFFNRMRVGDKTAYRHGIKRGEEQGVWGMKCLETIPAGRVGWVSAWGEAVKDGFLWGGNKDFQLWS